MLKVLLILSMLVGVPLLQAQTPSDTDTVDATNDTVVDIDQLLDRHLDTFAELESWVLAETALADIAHAINVEDIVTPLEDFLKTTIKNLSETFASFSASELDLTLELTPENHVIVKSIDPEGRFHLTDLKPNDVITEINGELALDRIDDPVQTVQYYLFPYVKVLKGFPPLVLSVNRGGKSIDVEIRNDAKALQTFPYQNVKLNTPALQWVNDGQRTLAFQYELPPSVFLLEVESELGQYFDVEFGVLVLQAPKDRMFEAGDILLKIEDTSIRSVDHVTKALKRSDNETIKTIVKRKGKRVELEMDRSSVIFRNTEEQMTH